MITTVTLNPAVDKVVEISNMALGQVHRISKQTLSLGGKSINVARLLSGFNCDTSAICYLGQDNQSVIKRLAQRDDIQLNPIILDGTTRTNVKVVEPDMDYRTTDINEPGFIVNEPELEKMIQLITEHAKQSKFVVLSGSLPIGVDKAFYKKMAKKLSEYSKVIIDADGEALNLAMEGSPYMIKPNHHELEAATGIQIETEEDIIKTAKHLISHYNIEYVLVSRGENGSVLVGKDIILSADVLPVQVVSTVGAGDSMLAGFVYGMYEQAPIKTSLAYGVAASSIAISTQEHKKITIEQLTRVAETVTIKEL